MHPARSPHSLWASLCLLAVAAACAGIASRRAPGVAPALAGTQALIDDRLVFGRTIPGGGEVSDSAWAAFMSDVIAPRFPAGLTLWRAEGQWRDPRGDVVRERVMVVEVLHPQGIPADSVFARIAAEYRGRFHQDAVLRISAPARTWMYTAP